MQNNQAVRDPRAAAKTTLREGGVTIVSGARTASGHVLSARNTAIVREAVSKSQMANKKK